jgi:hypothetical protein
MPRATQPSQLYSFHPYWKSGASLDGTGSKAKPTPSPKVLKLPSCPLAMACFGCLPKLIVEFGVQRGDALTLPHMVAMTMQGPLLPVCRHACRIGSGQQCAIPFSRHNKALG